MLQEISFILIWFCHTLIHGFCSSVFELFHWSSHILYSLRMKTFYFIMLQWKHFIMLLVNFWVFVLYRYIQTLRQTLISNLKGNLPSFDIFSSILIRIFKLVNCLLMQPCPRFPVFIWLCRTPCCFCGHSVPCYTWSFWWGWWHSGVALIEPKNIILAT